MVAYLDEGGARYLVRKVLGLIQQPVGSLYFSTSSTSPASLFGGTWERYAQGRVMVSASDTDKDFTVGKASGEKTAPIDLNNLYALWANSGQDFIADVETIPGNNTVWRATVKSQTLNHYATTDVANNGLRIVSPAGVDPRRVSTIQPYVAVFIWRRTA